jgi:hypothetical protein
LGLIGGPVGVPSTTEKRRETAGSHGKRRRAAQGANRAIAAGQRTCSRNLAKVGVAGSSPVVRSRAQPDVVAAARRSFSRTFSAKAAADAGFTSRSAPRCRSRAMAMRSVSRSPAWMAHSPPSVLEQRTSSRTKAKASTCVENQIARALGLDGPAEVVGLAFRRADRSTGAMTSRGGGPTSGTPRARVIASSATRSGLPARLAPSTTRPSSVAMCSSNLGGSDGSRASATVTTDISSPTPGQGRDPSDSASARPRFCEGESELRVMQSTSTSREGTTSPSRRSHGDRSRRRCRPGRPRCGARVPSGRH